MWYKDITLFTTTNFLVLQQYVVAISNQLQIFVYYLTKYIYQSADQEETICNFCSSYTHIRETDCYDCYNRVTRK